MKKSKRVSEPISLSVGESLPIILPDKSRMVINYIRDSAEGEPPLPPPMERETQQEKIYKKSKDFYPTEKKGNDEDQPISPFRLKMEFVDILSKHWLFENIDYRNKLLPVFPKVHRKALHAVRREKSPQEVDLLILLDYAIKTDCLDKLLNTMISLVAKEEWDYDNYFIKSVETFNKQCGKRGRYKYDVFMCHNKKDKNIVTKLKEQLEKSWIKPCLDQTDFQPGNLCWNEISEKINASSSAIICHGNNDIGKSQEKEINMIYSKYADQKYSIFPIILPGSNHDTKLHPLFKSMIPIDFRGDEGIQSEPFKQLFEMITGYPYISISY